MTETGKDLAQARSRLLPISAREEALRAVLKVMGQSRHDELPVFDVILKYAARLCNADMGGLVLINAGRTHYDLVAQRGARPEFVDFLARSPPELDPERYAAARAMIEKRVIHVEDLASPALYGAKDQHRTQSTGLEGIRTTLFVPLIDGDQAIGAIGLWRRFVAAFNDDEISLVKSFSEQAVNAIENARQFKELERKSEEIQSLNTELSERVEKQVAEIERVNRLRRFLPPSVVETVIRDGEDMLLKSRRVFVALLFADLRGFASFCETAGPDKTMDVLKTYHASMGELLAAFEAGVYQRAGDGIMAVFNDPVPCANPAQTAVEMALAMRIAMTDHCSAWAAQGHRLGFGVGISLGVATVGMVGSDQRYEYVASGQTTNIASRLCDDARDGEVLVCAETRNALGNSVEFEERGPRHLKGLKAPIDVYNVLRSQSDGPAR